jgi:hypothetical protein
LGCIWILGIRTILLGLLSHTISAHSKTGKSDLSKKTGKSHPSQKTKNKEIQHISLVMKNKYLIYPFAIAQSEVHCLLSAKYSRYHMFLVWGG